MPPRDRYYDPIVQSDPPPERTYELPPIKGWVAEAPGLYLRRDDIVACLGVYALEFHGEGREALLAVADVFVHLGDPDDAQEAPGAPEAPSESVPLVPQVRAHLHEAIESGAAAVAAGRDEFPDVARIEVYPNTDGTYWYARPVNHAGVILRTVLDRPMGPVREQVELTAANRWPGKPLFEIADEMGDSLWDEQHSSSTWNGRRRPSPRRMFA